MPADVERPEVPGIATNIPAARDLHHAGVTLVRFLEFVLPPRGQAAAV
jgi:hypothetical protein